MITHRKTYELLSPADADRIIELLRALPGFQLKTVWPQGKSIRVEYTCSL